MIIQEWLHTLLSKLECIHAGLASVLDADAKRIATMSRETFEKDGPLLVVASGQDTISVAGLVEKLAPENVFVVQIQHPRMNLSRFDVVITPRHDYYPLTPQVQVQIPKFFREWVTPYEPPNKNVFPSSVATCYLNLVFRDLISHITGHCCYRADLVKQLIGSGQNVLASCGSLRISFSRRTPQKSQTHTWDI
ncbi:mitochondrial fission protein ELM1-like [Papaver somniferum]|uniref:mitochondrial fission protein ELM1-like n=1 Tax=Papaver somniferum TaxID=3469 RepID=UPI000E6FD4D8|nr:mitochondrial fission protein ELM1-like [Papaver somniferum]